VLVSNPSQNKNYGTEISVGFLITVRTFRVSILKQATASSFQLPLPPGKTLYAVKIIVITIIIIIIMGSTQLG
jgi:hypothetical protein